MSGPLKILLITNEANVTSDEVTQNHLLVQFPESTVQVVVMEQVHAPLVMRTVHDHRYSCVAFDHPALLISTLTAIVQSMPGCVFKTHRSADGKFEGISCYDIDDREELVVTDY